MSRNCCRQPSVMSMVCEDHAAGLRQAFGVAARARAGAESRHGEGVDLRARQAEFLERPDGHQQRQRRIEAAREADHQAVDARVRQALGQARGLDGEDLLGPPVPLRVVARDERGGLDGALERQAGVGRHVHVDRPPRHVGEGVERVAEAGRALAVEAQVLDVHVGHQQVALARELPRLADDRAVFRHDQVAAEHHVLGGLADAARGVDVGADGAGRLLRDQRPPVIRLAHQLVRRGEVGDEVRPVQRLERAGRQRSPEVLADLHADDEALEAARAEQQVGADGDDAVADAHLAGDEVARGGEPALLVVFLVAGNIGLRDEAVDDAPREDRGGVEQVPLGGEREADDQQGAERGGGFRQGEQRPGRAVEQQVLMEQVAGRVAGDAQLGEHHHLGAGLVGLRGEVEDVVEVVVDVGNLQGRHRGGHPHEAEIGGGSCGHIGLPAQPPTTSH